MHANSHHNSDKHVVRNRPYGTCFMVWWSVDGLGWFLTIIVGRGNVLVFLWCVCVCRAESGGSW